ncbi:MAG: protein kinase [Myxococcales bacterium]|nr:protein kinase [Myxococcales bacterium]
MSSVPPSGIGQIPPFAGTSRFEPLESLGEGSTCVVYKVRDRHHGGVVALKTLRHLDGPSLYRLKQEFRALSHVDHPNLVRFYELIRSDDGWFVTMELVEGVDFLSWSRGEAAGQASLERGWSTWRTSSDLSAEPLAFSSSAPAGTAATEENRTPLFQSDPPGDLPDLLRLRSTLRQLVEGVAALHAAGRIHRDLKPSNVLVTDAGRVVVLDFGLVAEIDQDYTGGTLHQQIAGSAAYMSPEQAMGRPLHEASDWYAVGVMLYESLVGIWPYGGHVYEILTNKQQLDPPAPADLVPGVPDDLNALCMALLHRNPMKRPQGSEILAQLRYRRVQPGPSGRTPVLDPAFRDRDAQLETALDVWRTTVDEARPAVLGMHGPPGIGRTRLLRELVKQIRRMGAATLKTRCYEWESVPLRAIDGLVDNLTRVLRRADYDLLRILDTEDLSHLTAQFPTFSRVDALEILAATEAPADTLRVKALSELRTVLLTLAARKPLLLAIDDVQHADTDSADALMRVLRAATEAGLPVLLMITYPTEPPNGFVGWLSPLLEEAGVPFTQLPIPPLTEGQACQLAAEMLGLGPDDPVAQSVAKASKGVVGTLHQRVREAMVAEGRRAELSGQLTQLVASAIEGLPDEPRRLLELLVVAESPLDRSVAMAASQLQDPDPAILVLRAHDLITPLESGDLEVTLRGVSDYVQGRLSEATRRERHRDLARALELAGHSDVRALVRHWAGAGATEQAAMLAWSAASEALESRAWDEATWLLRQALAHDGWSERERSSMQGHLGEVLLLLGEGREAATWYRRAAGAFDHDRQMRLKLRAAEALLTCGAAAEGLPLLDEVLEASGCPSVPSAFLAGGVAAWRRWWAGSSELDFEARSALEVDVDQLTRVDATWTAADVLRVTDPARANAMRPIHVEAALEVGEAERAVRALAGHVSAMAADGDPADAVAALEALRERVQPLGDEVAEAFVATAVATVALQTGQLQAAVEASRGAEVLLRRTASAGGWLRLQVRATALRAQLWRGEPLQVQAEIGPLLKRALQAEDRVGAVELAAGDLVLAQAATDPEAALTQLETAVAVDGWEPSTRQAAWIGIARAWLTGVLTPGPEAIALATNIPDVPDAWIRSLTWRVRGIVCLHAGDLRGASAAASRLDEASRPWTGPWATLIRAGAVAARGGDPTPELQAATQALDELGFTLDARAIDAVRGRDEGSESLARAGVKNPSLFARFLVCANT